MTLRKIDENMIDPNFVGKVNDHTAQLAETVYNPYRLFLKLLKMLEDGNVTGIKLIGDSITMGNAATGYGENLTGLPIGTTGHFEANFTAPSWANYFRNYITAKYPTINFFNAGIGGWSAKTEGTIYRDTWIGTNNDVVFVMLGANDRSDCANEDEFFVALEAFILQVQANSNEVIVMTSPPTLNDYYNDGTKNAGINLTMDQIDKVISSVCMKHNLPHISFYQEFLQYNLLSGQGLNTLLQSSLEDGVLPGSHPTDNGHLLMWKILQQKLGLISNTHDWENDKLVTVDETKDTVNATSIDLSNIRLANIPRNGTFSDGSLGWSVGGGTLSVSNRVANVVSDGSTKYLTLQTSIFPKAIPSNQKMYVRALVKPNDAHLKLYFRTTISGVSNSTLEAMTEFTLPVDQYNNVSNILTTPIAYDSGTPYAYIQTEYADAATANGKSFDVKNVVVLNLTEIFGVGNEPTKEVMDQYLSLHEDVFIEKTTRSMTLDNVDMIKILAFPVLKVNNEVNNGEFVDATGWTPVYSTLNVTNKTATVTGNGSSAFSILNSSAFSSPIPSNHKVYIRTSIKPEHSQKRIFLRLAISGVSGSTIDVISPITFPVGLYTKVSNIVTTPVAYDSGTPYAYIQTEYLTAAAANGSVYNVQNILVIDLTEMFGAGNEPSKDVMDKLLL